MSKQLLAAMQNEVLDEPGTDCGCTKTVPVVITNKNGKDFEYRYIVDGNKLVCLNPTNLPKYIGKEVHLRSPEYCINPKICNICAGELEYKLGKRNVGLGTSRISNALLKLGMKKFHTANIQSKQIDVADMLI